MSKPRKIKTLTLDRHELKVLSRALGEAVAQSEMRAFEEKTWKARMEWGARLNLMKRVDEKLKGTK